MAAVSNPYRFIFNTPDSSAAVWVCVRHPDYGDVAARTTVVATPNGPVRLPVGGPIQFRALLRDSATGAETVLERKAGGQLFKRELVICGYLLPGPLEGYHGTLLRIESTNREEVVTFRIP
jgi:hypothetical protein